MHCVFTCVWLVLGSCSRHNLCHHSVCDHQILHHSVLVFITPTLMYCNTVICYWNVTARLLYWFGKFENRVFECKIVHMSMYSQHRNLPDWCWQIKKLFGWLSSLPVYLFDVVHTVLSPVTQLNTVSKKPSESSVSLEVCLYSACWNAPYMCACSLLMSHKLKHHHCWTFK